MSSQCSRCKQSQATVHINFSSKGTHEHLCLTCVQKEQAAKNQKTKPPAKPSDQLIDIIRSPLPSFKPASASPTQPQKPLLTLFQHGGLCPSCHTALAQLAESGKIGCADCYRHFRKTLIPVVESLHGYDQHVGHAPQISSDANQDSLFR